MTAEFSLQQLLHQDLRQAYLMVMNTEIWENMRTDGRPMSEAYASARKVMTSSSADEYHAIFGLSGSGKTALTASFAEVLEQDPHLRESIARMGLEMEVVRVPFAMAAVAAMVEGIVPPVGHGKYGLEGYKAITSWTARETASYIAQGKGKRKAITLLETSGLAAAPLISYPSADVYNLLFTHGATRQEPGVNKLHGFAYTLALNPKTREHTHFWCLKQDKNVGKEAVDIRKDDNLVQAFEQHGTKVIITPPHTGNPEQIIRVTEEFTLAEQAEIARFMTLTFAPPEVVLQSDQDFLRLHGSLFPNSRIGKADERQFYAYLRKTLHMAKRNLHHVQNPLLGGEKTVDLGYQLKSPLVRRPKVREAIVPACLREFVTPLGNTQNL